MLDLLKARRSIRRYEQREVEKEKIDALLKSGLLAPTSKDKHSWEFILVDDRDILAKLSKCKDVGAEFLANAPIAIVVAGNAEQSDVWVEDASIAAAFMQLTAQTLGLGSCWVQVRERKIEGKSSEEYVREALGLPEYYGVCCIIGVGYPAVTLKARDEANLLYEKLHRNRFGKAYKI